MYWAIVMHQRGEEELSGIYGLLACALKRDGLHAQLLDARVRVLSLWLVHFVAYKTRCTICTVIACSATLHQSRNEQERA